MWDFLQHLFDKFPPLRDIPMVSLIKANCVKNLINFVKFSLLLLLCCDDRRMAECYICKKDYIPRKLRSSLFQKFYIDLWLIDLWLGAGKRVQGSIQRKDCIKWLTSHRIEISNTFLKLIYFGDQNKQKFCRIILKNIFMMHYESVASNINA